MRGRTGDSRERPAPISTPARPVRAFFIKPREPIVHFKIKIKTAAGVQHLDGIFANKWAAVVAGMDVLGDAEGNVVATLFHRGQP